MGPSDSTWKHKKRGTLYDVIGEATLQVEGPYDMALCVIYRDKDSGRVWVRPATEFYDGRFERVSP